MYNGGVNGNVIVYDGATFRMASPGYDSVDDNADVTVNAGGRFEVHEGEIIDGLYGSGTVDHTISGTHRLTVQKGNFSGVITDASGALGFKKTGAGTMILSGNNSYSGLTEVEGGVLEVTGNGDVPGHATVSSGATLRLSSSVGSFSDNHTLTIDSGGLLDLREGERIGGLQGGGTVDVRDGETHIFRIYYGDFSGTIENSNGTLDFYKEGSGTLTLRGDNTYSGPTTVNGGTLEVTGSLANNGPAHVLVASAGTTFSGSEPNIVRRVADGASLAGLGSQIVGELGTQAELLAGTNDSGDSIDVRMAWRTFGAGEAQGALSNVLRLSGMADESQPTDPFVLQMTYDASLIGPSTGGSIYLAWLDDTQWVNAVAGNFGAGTQVVEEYLGSWDDFTSEYSADLVAHLGSWGVDTGDATVWAVLDHNSQFGVLGVPEPGTLALLMFGTTGLLAFGRRRQRSAR